MRQLLFVPLLAAFALTVLGGCSTTPRMELQIGEIFDPALHGAAPSDQANLVIYRGADSPEYIRHSIFVSGANLGRTENKTFLSAHVAPGAHAFHARADYFITTNSPQLSASDYAEASQLMREIRSSETPGAHIPLHLAPGTTTYIRIRRHFTARLENCFEDDETIQVCERRKHFTEIDVVDETEAAADLSTYKEARYVEVTR